MSGIHIFLFLDPNLGSLCHFIFSSTNPLIPIVYWLQIYGRLLRGDVVPYFLKEGYKSIPVLSFFTYSECLWIMPWANEGIFFVLVPLNVLLPKRYNKNLFGMRKNYLHNKKSRTKIFGGGGERGQKKFTGQKITKKITRRVDSPPSHQQNTYYLFRPYINLTFNINMY